MVNKARTTVIFLLSALIGGCVNVRHSPVVNGPGSDSLVSIEIADRVRAAATPVIDSGTYSRHRFTLLPDSSGVESVVFDNGDSLVVHNNGWEYYNLTFDFFTSTDTTNRADTVHWMETGVTLLEKLAKDVNSPVHILKCLNVYHKYVDKRASLKIGYPHFSEVIVCDTGEIEETMRFEKIEAMQNHQTLVSVSFSIGPL